MNETETEKIIEGIFDGEGMTADDGQRYPIPPNYASKSKLVEGDRLKLTVSGDGSFVFKQTKPVERKRLIANVKQEGRNFTAIAGEDKYRLLLASATYFELKEGDEVVVLVPKDDNASWAALENKVSL